MMSSIDTEISHIIIDLCATGTRTEGVFRRNGNASTVKYNPYETFGVYEKATRLKQCINEVKGKLVGRQLTKKLMKLVQKEDKAFPAVLKTLQDKLPRIHLQLISYVVELLRLIAENEDVTLMNPRNLSICLTPTIFDVAANKLMEGTTFDLLEQMIRHPMELLPYHELYVKNLMCHVEAKSSCCVQTSTVVSSPGSQNSVALSAPESPNSPRVVSLPTDAGCRIPKKTRKEKRRNFFSNLVKLTNKLLK